MNILLDTHLIIWALYAPDRLPEIARGIISDPDNWINYSIISLWETELKHLKHPEDLSVGAREIERLCFKAGYAGVELRSDHVLYLPTLKLREDVRHKDPFDKMLIAQAKSEGMVFLTYDKRLTAYGEACVKYV